MEMRDLQALVEVAKSGGFTAAARALGTTQSTVSKAIGQLEHDCGARLLRRSRGQVELTEAGQMVRDRAVNILDERDRILDELSARRGLTKGYLRLGLPSLGSTMIFAPLVAAYRKKYPQVSIVLKEQGSRQLEDYLRRGEIEVGASLLPVPKEFETAAIRTEPIMAILPEEHPLGKRESVKLDELANEPMVLFDTGFALNTIIAAAFRRRRLPLRESVRGGNVDVIVALVAAGLGVAMLPQLVVKPSPKGVRVVRVAEDDMLWRLVLIWRDARDLSPAAQRWIEMVSATHSGEPS